ncbi:hypothetical protein WJX74_000612 [Apatococcus lobatus]|uniref:J domain-containing protein n=1 Tax=Apatococcus lobatus TaxID=904363 RepID=A0AAW1QZU7_9CHLO
MHCTFVPSRTLTCLSTVLAEQFGFCGLAPAMMHLSCALLAVHSIPGKHCLKVCAAHACTHAADFVLHQHFARSSGWPFSDVCISSSTTQSLYEVLGVSDSATDREIKKAFKQKALKLHPDVNKAANASEQFQECKMAYQTLIDSAARDKYNRELRDGKPGGFDWDNIWNRGRTQAQQPQSQSRAQKPAKKDEEPFYGFSDFFRDVSADWDATRRRRAAKGTPTGSIWQELAGLGEDFVEFLEHELSKSSDPELRRQAQESAQASSGPSDSAQTSFNQSSSSADRTSSSTQARSTSSGWSDPSGNDAQSRAAQIRRENDERKQRANAEVDDMLADMKRRPSQVALHQATALRRCADQSRTHRQSLHKQGCKHRRPRRLQAAETAQSTEQSSSESPSSVPEGEFYEVELKKPLGIKFGRGNDGEAYVLASDKRLGDTDDQVQPGDKIVKCSASFGPDIWDARNFGQVMYAIKTRNGDVYLKFLKRNGDMDIFKEPTLSEQDKAFKNERGGGNYGAGTRALQEQNFMARQKREKMRKEMFEDALNKFRSNDIEQALYTFEEVLGLEPKSITGRDMSKVSQIYRVTQYNIACCYSGLNQVDASLDALEQALKAGFEGYNKIREDPNLENLRKSKKFAPLIDKYDEPVFNSGAFDALKSLFRRN